FLVLVPEIPSSAYMPANSNSGFFKKCYDEISEASREELFLSFSPSVEKQQHFLKVLSRMADQVKFQLKSRKKIRKLLTTTLTISETPKTPCLK
ncbi:MAG: hypothetical protein Q4D76_20100, partial [Oscillospiraceae bacterium]|nr:hypothetical protein [Oscillospiraceae bacterium]